MTNRKLYFRLCLFLAVTILVSSVMAFSVAEADQERGEAQVSPRSIYTCTLDFTVEPFYCDCEPPIELKWVDDDENRAVMKIDMENRWGVENVDLKMKVYFNKSPWGWVMNLGNSNTNNGAGGDSGTFSCDSEFDIRVIPGTGNPNTLSVYPNDYGGMINRPLLVVQDFFPTLSPPQDDLQAEFIVKDHHMSVDFLASWWPINAELNSEYLFRLNHEDEEGGPDWIYWLGVNRVVHPLDATVVVPIDQQRPTYRRGGGINKIEFTRTTWPPLEESEKEEAKLTN